MVKFKDLISIIPGNDNIIVFTTEAGDPSDPWIESFSGSASDILIASNDEDIKKIWNNRVTRLTHNETELVICVPRGDDET